ncbi:MAG: hypothetical protein MJK08_00020 [Campylobacterales bacterium]|nr:hypothetical protein [Campylobacterales bacterium]
MTIIRTLLFLFILLFFASCASNNVYLKSEKEKNTFIKKANHGNLDAMILLNQHYDFPHTEEGLYYYNKWYNNISKNNKENNILKLAIIYGKYQNMFPNGKDKTLKLFSYIDKENNYKVQIELIKYYVNNYMRPKRVAIHNKIINALNEKELNDLLFIYVKKREFTRNEVANLLLKKDLNISSENILLVLELSAYSKDKHMVSSLEKRIIQSKNVKDILALAKINKKQYKTQKAIKNLNYVLELDKNNNIAQFELAKIYASGNSRDKVKRDVKKSIDLYKLASDNSNIHAKKELLSIYSKREENKTKYLAIKKELEQSDEGMLMLASYYEYHYKNEKEFNVLEKLAKKGNDKAILLLALNKTKFKDYQKDNSNYWLNYIKNSKNEKNINDLYKSMNTYEYKRKFKKELIEYANTKLKSKDILVLRKLMYNSYSKENKMLILKKLAEYKDVKALASLTRYYKKKNNFDKAVKTATILAEMNDKKFLYLLAQVNRYTLKNKEKAIFYYKKAAKFGHSRAIRDLTTNYVKNYKKSND